MMCVRDMLAMVVSATDDEPVLETAQQLRTRFEGAHVSVLAFLQKPQVKSRIEMPDAAVMGGVAFVGERTQAQSGALEESILLSRRLERIGGRTPLRRIEIASGAEADLAGLEARCVGLTLMMRPAGLANEPFRRAMFESVLYESGRPLILTPPEWRNKPLGRVVLIAWDGSREAARAVADAQPLLAEAEAVHVFSIHVAGRNGPSGMALGAHLRRSGLRCHQRTITGARHEIESLLLGECAAVGADLLVMGGYGHARLHELLFGGVTRSLVRASPIPLFISR